MSFRLNGVTYSYPRAADPALLKLTATIPSNQTTAVLGQSGSGKTTLLNLLGLLWEGRLAEGSIVYAPPERPELDYGTLSALKRTQLRLTEFGFVLQTSYLLPHFTCAENISMPLALQGVGRREREARTAKLVALADPKGLLAKAMPRLAGQVAGGQKQRTAVLRAIIHNPRVLFADEPVSNLDPENTALIVDLLCKWREGQLSPDTPPAPRLLVLVCHDPELAFHLADHFLVLGERDGLAPVRLLAKRDLPGGTADLRQLIKTGLKLA